MTTIITGQCIFAAVFPEFYIAAVSLWLTSLDRSSCNYEISTVTESTAVTKVTLKGCKYKKLGLLNTLMDV